MPAASRSCFSARSSAVAPPSSVSTRERSKHTRRWSLLTSARTSGQVEKIWRKFSRPLKCSSTLPGPHSARSTRHPGSRTHGSGAALTAIASELPDAAAAVVVGLDPAELRRHRKRPRTPKARSILHRCHRRQDGHARFLTTHAAARGERRQARLRRDSRSFRIDSLGAPALLPGHGPHLLKLLRDAHLVWSGRERLLAPRMLAWIDARS